jgi:hypothetical protein
MILQAFLSTSGNMISLHTFCTKIAVALLSLFCFYIKDIKLYQIVMSEFQCLILEETIVNSITFFSANRDCPEKTFL